MSQAVTQAEFANMLGVVRSYVTKLKQSDRLVLGSDGLVLVEESAERIYDTADPNRMDVADRWAEKRELQNLCTYQSEQLAEKNKDGPGEESERMAKVRAMRADADMKEMMRDKQAGQLIERIAVEAAIEDVMTTVRQALEQQPHRVAPMLVGLDLDAIRATLKQENYAVLAEMVKDFSNRIKQMAGEEE